jgi:hypothetical protein
MPFGVLATSDGKGLSLLGYPYADPLYGGVVIKGVFVHDDGSAAQ